MVFGKLVENYKYTSTLRFGSVIGRFLNDV